MNTWMTSHITKDGYVFLTEDREHIDRIFIDEKEALEYKARNPNSPMMVGPVIIKGPLTVVTGSSKYLSAYHDDL